MPGTYGSEKVPLWNCRGWSLKHCSGVCSAEGTGAWALDVFEENWHYDRL